jgi:hypothetical protein
MDSRHDKGNGVISLLLVWLSERFEENEIKRGVSGQGVVSYHEVFFHSRSVSDLDRT